MTFWTEGTFYQKSQSTF